ncbi:MAG: zinc-binding dehydrogenase [Candidatus Ratteibacteria bacterium]|jgi:S-(hydroxymethyl)glutathione dehydrogenase/alcohol dehydrogenase
MKSWAAVLYKQNGLLKIEELTVPDLKPGQVLVKIAYSGVCRSQLNEIRGLKGEDKFLPHTLGHEGSGIVEKVGEGVKKVKVGDHAVLTWIKGKGAEVPSTLYKKSDGSIVNSGAIATFLTKAVISENRLVKISDEMPLREAALLGCAIPTGAGIIMNTVKLSKGDTVAIFGVGGIGLSVLLAAKLKQAFRIIAVDIFDHKLYDALRLGATHVINAKKQDVLTEILRITDKRGVDYAIECAGVKESMETAFKSIRDQGGLCVVAGNLSYGENISINPFDLIKGKRIVGTWGGETRPDRDVPEYAGLYLNKKLRIDLLVASEYCISDINLAFKELAGKEIVGRVLIKMLNEEGRAEANS